MNINKIIGLAFGLGIITLLHLGFQPSAAPKSEYVQELEKMQKNCENPEECQAISRVLARALK